MISLFIPCLPTAQPRQRHRLVTTQSGRQFATNYTPAKHPVNEFKAVVRLAVHEAMADRLEALPILDSMKRPQPFEFPMRVEARFIFPRPASMRWKKREMPQVPHAKKPDLENVVKALLDSLTGLVWVDDAQVCELCVSKVVAAADEQPGVQLRVTAADKLTTNGQEEE